MKITLKTFIRNQSLKILRSFSLYYYFSLTPKGNKSLKQIQSYCKTYYYSQNKPIKNSPPITISSVIPTKFIEAIKPTPFEVFVIEMEKCRVWGTQGAVITNDGYLLTDVSREFSNTTHSIYQQVKLIPYTILNGTTAVIAASGGNVYFHWMFDIMPRINLLKKAGVLNQIDRFILNYTGKAFQKETLIKLGIDESKILASNDHWNFHFQLEKLLIPSLPSPNDCPSLESCIFLRNLYKYNISNTNQKRRLYIQRKNSRLIINEAEVLSQLKRLNFEIIDPSLLPIEEQAKAFSEAEIVVGAHGAGFTNIVFCKPNTRIIDLFAPEWINPCYWIISNHINLNYYFLVGETPLGGAVKENKSADIYIDTSKFKKLLTICLNHE